MIETRLPFPLRLLYSLTYVTAMCLYNAIVVVVGPLLVRRRMSADDQESRNRQWNEQHPLGNLGPYTHPGALLRPRAIWLHCSSAGELEGLRPLIRDFVEHYTGIQSSQPVVLTYTSRAVQERAVQALQEEVGANFNALFLPEEWKPWRFWQLLTLFKPRFLIVAEKEFWPNLFFFPWLRGIPVLLVNAAIDPKSSRSSTAWRRFLFRWIFSYGLTLAYARSEPDADRLRRDALHPGVHIRQPANSRVESVFRAVERFHTPAEIGLWRQFYGLSNKEPVAIAASIHPQEYDLVLALMRRVDTVDKREPAWHWILAPHREVDAEDLCRILDEAGIAYQRKSELLEPNRLPQKVRVTIEDHVGDLLKLYGLSQLVYIGGGGGNSAPGLHNPVEPALSRAFVLFGPNVGTYAEDVGALVQQRAGLALGHPSGLDQIVNDSSIDWDGLRLRATDPEPPIPRSQQQEYEDLRQTIVEFGATERRQFGWSWWRSYAMRLVFWAGLYLVSLIQYGPWHHSGSALLAMAFMAFTVGFIPEERVRVPWVHALRLLFETVGYGWFVQATGGIDSPYLASVFLPFVSAFGGNPFLSGDKHAKERMDLAGWTNGIALVAFFAAQTWLPKGHPPEYGQIGMLLVFGLLFLFLVVELFKINRQVLDFREEVETTERVRGDLQKLQGEILPESDPFVRLEKLNGIMRKRVRADSSHILWQAAHEGTRLYLAVTGEICYDKFRKVELKLESDGAYPCVRAAVRRKPVILQDAEHDPGMLVIARTLPESDTSSEPKECRSAKSVACFPLIDSHGEVLGVISFVSEQPRFFTETRTKIIMVLLEHLKDPLRRLAYTRNREANWLLDPDFDETDPRVDLAHRARTALEKMLGPSSRVRIEVESSSQVISQTEGFDQLEKESETAWDLEASNKNDPSLGRVVLRFQGGRLPIDEIRNESLRSIAFGPLIACRSRTSE